MKVTKIAMRLFLALALVLSLLPVAPASPVAAAGSFYVTTAGDASGTCAGWANACDLQTALSRAQTAGGGQVWVAQGTYKPTTDTNRDASFSLRNNVAILGGFRGDETAASQRNPSAHVTVLSGEIGGAGYPDNSKHVVYASGTNATAVLDGFTVTHGNDYPDGGVGHGGGIYIGGGAATLSNLHVDGNQADYGAAIYIIGAAVSLTNVGISGNSGGWASLEAVSGASAVLNNVRLYGNRNAAMAVDNASLTGTNVVVSGHASWWGSGLMIFPGGNVNLTNATFHGNYAESHSPVASVNGGSLVLTNSVVWGNTAGAGGAPINTWESGTWSATYSIVEGFADDPALHRYGSAAYDPLFWQEARAANLNSSTAGGDLRLQASSPAIDAGNNAAAGLVGFTTDLLGQPRFQNDPGKADTGNGTAPLVDLGAYEFQGATGYDSGIIYVDTHVPGGTGGNGRSWAGAFNNLAWALSVASPGPGQSVEVWVADGGHKPTSGNERTATFTLKNGVAIYGGFAGNDRPGGAETSREQRDWVANLTFLDADVGAYGTATDNVYHLVTALPGTNSTAVLDGFTVMRGYANDAIGAGGGLLVDGNPTLANLDVKNNYATGGGGGLAVLSGQPTLTNVTFRDNTANYGAAVAVMDSRHVPVAATLTNVAFSGNYATGNGGALYFRSSPNTITVTNATFSGNRADGSGTAVYLQAGTMALRNSIVWANYLAATPAVVNAGGDPAALNFDRAIVQGGCPSGATCANVVDANPNFVTPVGGAPTESGNLRLQSGSPAMNAGDPAYLPAGLDTDLGGLPRVVGDTLDLGPYEYQGLDADTVPPVVTVASLAGTGGVDASSPFQIASAPDAALPTVTWSANEPGTYEVQEGGTDCATGTTVAGSNVSGAYTSGSLISTIDISSWSESAHTVRVCVTDVATRTGASTAEITVTKDVTSPTGITLVTPVQGSSTSVRPTFGGAAASAAGDSPTVTVKIYSGGTATGTPVRTVNIARSGASYSQQIMEADTLAPGIYTARAEQRDHANNVGYSATSNTFTVNVITGRIYVNAANTGPGVKDGFSWATAYPDLQSALTAASPAEGQTIEIWVAAGTYKPSATGDRSATFRLQNGVKIYGGFTSGQTELGQRNTNPATNGTVLSGEIGAGGVSDNSYHVVTAPAGTLNTAVLNGFTISDGYGDTTGGGMLASGNPTLANLKFSGNTATSGGGLYLDGSPTLSGLTFSGNTATNGGGLYLQSGSPALTTVTFSSNSAVNGGGLYVQTGSPTLNGVTFSGNNVPYGNGGGLYNAGGSPSLTTVTFSGNGAGNGGGLYNDTGNPILNGVTFTGNAATDLGGGLYNASGAPALNNVTFGGSDSAQANTATTAGGGLFSGAGDATLTLVTFSKNTAANGGGLYVQGGSPTLSRVAFAGNAATIGSGGGLYNQAGSPTLVNAAFSQNTAAGGGGGMHTQGGSPALTNVSLGHNTAASGGGLNATGGTPTLTNGVVWGNSAPTGAQVNGSVAVTYSDVQSSFTGTGNINVDPKFVSTGNLDLQAGSGAIDQGNNAASGLAGVTTDLLGRGRLHDDPGTLPTPPGGPAPVDMGAYEFQGSTSVSSGRLYVDKDATGSNNGSSWANAFTELSAALAVANPGTGTTEIWVANGTYKPTNTADRNAAFTLKNNIKVYGGFAGGETELGQRNTDPATNGTVLSGDLSGNDGASFANRGDNSSHVVVAPSGTTSTAVLDGFTVRGGNDTVEGGGLYVAGSPALANLIIADNYSGYHGGGMYAGGGGTPTLSNVTFNNNRATYAGGGLVVDNPGSATLNNVAFSGNSADVGGGMALTYGAGAVLANVTFSGNSAGFEGGGLQTEGGSPTLVNVVFSGNTATVRGGGLNNAGGAPQLTNVTFAGNTADYGGGIYSYGALTLTNAILWGNSAPQQNQIYADPSTRELVISYSDVEGSGGSAAWALAGTTDGGHNVDVPPAFVSPVSAASAPTTAGDYRLLASSPAIDAGNNAAAGLVGVAKDPAGNDRILDGPDADATATVDLGAYEYAGPVNVAPAVTTQPTNQTVIAGQTATFTAAATGTSTPTVQWQVSADGITWNNLTDGGVVSGATSGTLSLAGVTTTMSGNQYKAVFSNAAGSATSNPATLTINTLPVVTSNPTDQTVAAGGTATFTAAATGNPTPTVRWQVLTPTSGGTWVNVDGATSTTLTLGNVTVAMNGYRYLAIFTNAAGYVFSGAATLTVTPPNTAPTVAAGTDESILEGGIVIKSATITDPNSSAWTATVDWGDGSAIQHPTVNNSTRTFGISHVYADNGSYTAIVTVSDGELTGTDTLLVTVNNVAPTVNAGAATATVNPGQPFSRSGSFTDPGADVWAATVDYGDGTGVQPLTLTGKTFSLSHVYATPGAYTVTVTVTETDDEAASGQGSVAVTVDAAPTVTINQAAGQADPTSGSTINFTVVFSEVVTDFATGDVSLSGTAGASTATVTGSGTTYNVAVTGMTTSGTVVATVAAGVAHDAAGNGNAASASTDNTVAYTPPPSFLYAKEAGNGNCLSWATACGLQTALSSATAGSQIWVASGTYKPSVNYSLASFEMRDGVAIYGGFPNTGTPGWGDRDWRTNVTILSGALGGGAANSYHVVTVPALATSSAILDGFTIQGGYALYSGDNGAYSNAKGGGIYSLGAPTLRNLIVRANTAHDGAGA
ncbi:MAG: beta strand repeat-containing protein [Chloroflexota bacterium]